MEKVWAVLMAMLPVTAPWPLQWLTPTPPAVRLPTIAPEAARLTDALAASETSPVRLPPPATALPAATLTPPLKEPAPLTVNMPLLTLVAPATAPWPDQVALA